MTSSSSLPRAPLAQLGAAKRAIGYGYRRVDRFPEGVEGWRAAGHAAIAKPWTLQARRALVTVYGWRARPVPGAKTAPSALGPDAIDQTAVSVRLVIGSFSKVR